MSSKHVRSSHVVTVHLLNDEEEDRRSQWMRIARDRYHFRRRISTLWTIDAELRPQVPSRVQKSEIQYSLHHYSDDID